MYLDRKKAREIIEREIKKGKKIDFAYLTLEKDGKYKECVYADGDFYHKKHCTCFGYSCWAKPLVVIYYKDRISENFECYCTRKPEDYREYHG